MYSIKRNTILIALFSCLLIPSLSFADDLITFEEYRKLVESGEKTSLDAFKYFQEHPIEVQEAENDAEEDDEKVAGGESVRSGTAPTLSSKCTDLAVPEDMFTPSKTQTICGYALSHCEKQNPFNYIFTLEEIDKFVKCKKWNNFDAVLYLDYGKFRVKAKLPHNVDLFDEGLTHYDIEGRISEGTWSLDNASNYLLYFYAAR